MRVRHVILSFVVLVSATAVAVSCENESTAPQATTSVTVKDNEFEPRNAAIMAGQTITWNWTGNNPHNVTFDDGTIGNSATQSSGTFMKTFAVAGSYPYHCTIHGQSMSATITVQ